MESPLGLLPLGPNRGRSIRSPGGRTGPLVSPSRMILRRSAAVRELPSRVRRSSTSRQQTGGCYCRCRRCGRDRGRRPRLVLGESRMLVTQPVNDCCQGLDLLGKCGQLSAGVVTVGGAGVTGGTAIGGSSGCTTGWDCPPPRSSWTFPWRESPPSLEKREG